VAIVSLAYPWMASQPVSITTNAGATVSFPVTAIGQAPLYYQWYNSTQPLTNGVNISGATDSTLTLSNVAAADSGSYFLVVTNGSGVTSNAMATLTVIDLTTTPPVIVSGSAGFNRTNGFGFNLTAQSGQTIVVEISTNLVDWQPVFTNMFDTDPVSYRDLTAITNRSGFYRLRLQ
jgi:hypothetical protein